MSFSKRKQKYIFQFFRKKSNVPLDNNSDEEDTPSDVSESSTKSSTNNDSILKSSSISLSNDIGHFVGDIQIRIDDHTKFRLLNSWKPDPSYNFPYSIHIKNGIERKRYLRYNHFENYSWLVFSEKYAGLFCKFCVLSNKNGGKQKNVPLQKLVTKPLKEFAKLLGKNGCLETHNSNKYHKEASLCSSDFLKTYMEPSKNVANLVITERMRQCKENRERLKPIIQSIIFLGKQNIALRGHRENNNLTNTTSHSSTINQGNFLELLKFRISAGDQTLENHLKTTHSKATYLSHSIQEEIIQCCRYEIISFILKEVKNSRYFSIIFDETTDISNISQMSLSLRYIDSNHRVQEKFINFLDCHEYVYGQGKRRAIMSTNNIDHESDDNLCDFDPTKKLEPKLSGEILGDTVVSILKEMSIELNDCVGIGTDGCTVMTSTIHGAVQQIKKSANNAIHSPCSNHSLNLSISKSSNVQSVRNSMGIIQDIISFLINHQKEGLS